MRLTVPEPKIEHYKDGFAEHDQLNRKETGDKLSELVERIDDPLVIALDGAWGSGKTFFLKCWVGEHLKREDDTTQTVYFDAFKHDFLDDPLIALTGAISDRFDSADDKPAQTAWRKAKQVAPALGRALLRTSVSVATAGIVSKADDLVDAAAQAIEGELTGTVADFWKKEDGKRAAMAAFREALVDLTEPKTEGDDKGEPQRKLVIVIDELDRCRPDYALSLLEIIKHFFNVDGVHFVLGVNLEGLQHSVRARYGSDVDAETYLQKFVNMRMTLNLSPDKHSSNPIWAEYFQRCADKMEFPEESKSLLKTTELILGRFKLTRDHSLRDVERVLTTLATIPNLKNKWYINTEAAIGTMAVLKVLRPTAYQRYRALSEVQFDSNEHFDASPVEYDRHGEMIILTWRAMNDINTLTDAEKEDLRQLSDSFGRQNWSTLLGKVANDLLEVFDLTDF